MADHDSKPLLSTYSESDLQQKEHQAQHGASQTPFEERQEARRERYEELADKARRESAAAFDHARRMASVIPFGQPILVGHHSEGRDRRYRARIWRQQDKSVELSKKADYYEQRAESVGKGGISSDDPQAIDKLRAELARLEEHHALMLTTNKAHKAFLRDPATLDSAELPDEIKTKIRNYKPAYSWEPHPIPPYRLTNNSANMRRIRQRIEALQDRPTESAERQVIVPGAQLCPKSENSVSDQSPSGGAQITIREDATENRVMLIFPGKPPEAVREILKRSGFKWSPTRGAWVRFLNDAGRVAAQYVLSKLENQQ